MITQRYLETGCALAGAFLSWFFGGLDGLLTLLVVFAVLDQITGIMKGYVLKKWSSEIGFNGIARKVCMFILVGMANVLGHELPSGKEVLRDGFIMFYVANEGISIIENSIDIGAPVPDGFKERFLSWRNKQLISKNKPEPDDE